MFYFIDHSKNIGGCLVGNRLANPSQSQGFQSSFLGLHSFDAAFDLCNFYLGQSVNNYPLYTLSKLMPLCLAMVWGLLNCKSASKVALTTLWGFEEP